MCLVWISNFQFLEIFSKFLSPSFPASIFHTSAVYFVSLMSQSLPSVRSARSSGLPIASCSDQPAASVLPSASRAVVFVLAPDWLSFRTSLLFQEKLPLVRRAGSVRLPRVACSLLSLLLLPRLFRLLVSRPFRLSSLLIHFHLHHLFIMSNIIPVQHFSGFPNDDPASVSRICLQCIPFCNSFPNWIAITPSYVQFDAMVPSALLDCNWFYSCGICGEPCYLVLCHSDNPMPHGVLEQFPEPRVIELIPPAHQQHPAPAIMAGFDFYGFELPLELQSDDEATDAESDSSLSSDDCDSALEDSASLSDSDSVSSRW
ncbi:DNA primase [Frankliniella fusca]|uniref:DNA primase n=1 Tax=Frankliniella fusca TaxID=407009 RepID=A0AAE1HSC6_9NEOP|nr:DNA primase [Frankliniella fusca]